MEVILRRDVGAEARAALRDEADRLASWLDGAVMGAPYAGRQRRGEPLP